MNKFKKTILGLIVLIVMGISIYLGYYQENEGLNNIGIFLTWIFSIFFLIDFFYGKADKQSNHIVIKIIANLVYISCIFALIYKGQYIHGSIWLMFLIQAKYRTYKKELDENIKKTN